MAARRKFTNEFRKLIALEVVKHGKKYVDITKEHNVHATQIKAWVKLYEQGKLGNVNAVSPPVNLGDEILKLRKELQKKDQYIKLLKDSLIDLHIAQQLGDE